jgi:hypothetical protein
LQSVTSSFKEETSRTGSPGPYGGNESPNKELLMSHSS